MNAPHKPLVEIEEVTSVLTPAPGVSVEQALRDAEISGYDKLEVMEFRVIVTWYKRKDG